MTDSDGLQTLLRRLQSEDDQTSIDAAWEIAELRSESAGPMLMELLRRFQSHRARCKAYSYALGELRYQQSLSLLLDVIESVPAGSRGSLAYAIMLLDCREVIDRVALLALDPCFEVRNKAVNALERVSGPVDARKQRTAIEKLEHSLSSDRLSDDVREAVTTAIELLNAMATSDQ